MDSREYLKECQVQKCNTSGVIDHFFQNGGFCIGGALGKILRQFDGQCQITTADGNRCNHQFNTAQKVRIITEIKPDAIFCKIS